METLTTNLNNTLENIKNKSLSYDEVSEILFSFDFQDYNEIFKINEFTK